MTRHQQSIAMREMPEDERPRERLARLGAEALRDAELVAILLRTGTRDYSAVAVAEMLIGHFHNIRNLSNASLEEIAAIKGIGRVKAIEVKAALELGKRLAAFSIRDMKRIRGAEDIAKLLMNDYKDAEQEIFKTVLLNTKNMILKIADVSSGGLDATMAQPRDVFRQAVREGAHAVIVCHNHPSGDPEPSRDDISLTKRLDEAATLLGIRFLDHVIFGDGRYVSLKERNAF
jgi:DNA repair protein RadC